MADPMKLTPKQVRFVQEYLIDLNAAQAAIRAGYSAKTAQVIGHENLDLPVVVPERALATMPCTVPTNEVWTPPAPGAGIA